MTFLSLLTGCFKGGGSGGDAGRSQGEQEPPARTWTLRYRNRCPTTAHSPSRSRDSNTSEKSTASKDALVPEPVDPEVAAHANRLTNIIITATDMRPVRRVWNDVCRNKPTYEHPQTGEDHTETLAAEVLERTARTIAHLGANEKLDEENARLLRSTEEIAPNIFALAEEDDYDDDKDGHRDRLDQAMAFVVAGTLMTMVAPWMLRHIGFSANGPIPGSLASQIQTRYMGGDVPPRSWREFLLRQGLFWP